MVDRYGLGHRASGSDRMRLVPVADVPGPDTGCYHDHVFFLYLQHEAGDGLDQDLVASVVGENLGRCRLADFHVGNSLDICVAHSLRGYRKPNAGEF